MIVLCVNFFMWYKRRVSVQSFRDFISPKEFVMAFRVFFGLSILALVACAVDLQSTSGLRVGDVASVAECQEVQGAACAGSLFVPWWQCTIQCFAWGSGVSWWPQTPDQPLCNGWLQLNPCGCGGYGDTYTYTGCTGV